MNVLPPKQLPRVLPLAWPKDARLDAGLLWEGCRGTWGDGANLQEASFVSFPTHRETSRYLK